MNFSFIYTYKVYFSLFYSFKFLLDKFNVKSILHITLLEFLLFVQPSNSASFLIDNQESMMSNNFISSNPSLVSLAANDFTKNKPILKSYGPLILDINNLNFDSGIILIPMLNVLFLKDRVKKDRTETLTKKCST